MLILISLVSSNRSLIYIKKRIDETGDPYGMPVFIAVFSDFSPSKANWIYLLFIKDLIHLHIDIGNFSRWQNPSSWFMDTWSNVPFMSKKGIRILGPLAYLAL
jgi:hypothetical protein